MKKITMNNKVMLQASYWTLCAISFLQLAFVSMLIYDTSVHVLQHRQAASFLQQVNVIPFAYYKVPLYAGCGFLILLLLMQMRSYVKETTKNILFFLLLEVMVCMIIMWATSFTTNEVLLLVLANMLLLTRKRENKGISLVIMTILYLGTNYHVISNFFSVTSFEVYLAMYNASAKSLFLGMRNVLSTLCIMCFIIYMLFLIQEQMKESKHMKMMNQELQDLNQQLKEYADVREKMGETKERNRLAREIHDTLGHTLTGLSTGLEACETLLEIQPELARKQLHLLSGIAKDGLHDVRRSVKKLRPDALENHTLHDALEEMIHDFVLSTGVKVHFVCHLESLDFQPDEEDAIYRFVQEGMTNSVRHGKADEIYISFGKDEDTLIIILEDNGCGCAKVSEGFGLHHMKERVALLHGNVRYYGQQGFVLIVEIPLRKGDGTYD